MTNPSALRGELIRVYSRRCARAAARSDALRLGLTSGPDPDDLSALAGYSDEALWLVDDGAPPLVLGCGTPLVHAALQPHERVLDLGAGAGLDLLLAAEAVGPGGKVVGVELTEALVEHARARIESMDMAQATIVQGLMEDPPVEDESFDVVVSNCAINLSFDKPAVYASIARTLTPGGRFVITDLVSEGLPDSLRDSFALRSACVAGTVDIDEFLAGLTAAGLTDLEVLSETRYDRDQLTTLIGSDPEMERAMSCCGGQCYDDRVEEIVDEVEGTVSSVVITGRRGHALRSAGPDPR